MNPSKMKPNKPHKYTQEEYNQLRVEWYERGYEEGQQEALQKLKDLLGITRLENQIAHMRNSDD